MKSHSQKHIMKYLERYKNLPGKCRLYQITFAGKIFVAGNGKILEISKASKEYKDTLHLFVNPGNVAHYLLGSPHTSEENPNNATFKVGITNPHYHFIPHAHGTEHYVVSQGFSGCLLFDHENKKAVPIKLLPGSIIYISKMVPHAFYNRSDIPLIILVANAGLGLYHEDYAITKKTAQKKLQKTKNPKEKAEIQELMSELDILKHDFTKTNPQCDLDARERIAIKLYRVAEYFSMH